MGRWVVTTSAACLLVAGCYGSRPLGEQEDAQADGSTDPVPDAAADLPDGADAECGGGLIRCHDECVDVMADDGNCGACGAACAADETCLAGACAIVCEEPRQTCGGACVDPMTDARNCGECGHDCAMAHATVSCVEGLCEIEDCDEGWWDINPHTDDGCEYACTATMPDEFFGGVEYCEDGLDNDCDGRVDGDDPDCAYTPPEFCNGLDDDCDTLVDEDFDCVMSQSTTCTTPCGSTGSGTCAETCEIPPPDECVPPDEACNGVDDDCDGDVDEGC